MVWIVIAVIALAVVVIGSNGGGASQAIAYAIGVAEGGYDASGNNLNNNTRPSRNHNPGDMTADLIGKSTGMDGPFVTYATDADGYADLVAQVDLWLNGGSAHATSQTTIAGLSSFYTADNQSSWAANVASVLGVSQDTPIGQV